VEEKRCVKNFGICKEVKKMGCSKEIVEWMHDYLDHDITKDKELQLKEHLNTCKDCQQHFHELKRTVTLLQSTSHIEAPADFTEKVMASLPKEKRTVGYKRWLKAHPILTAAAIFFLFMFSSIVTTWNNDEQLSVSKMEGLIIEGDTVIVPEGQVIKGDLVVENGNIKIEGKVDGDIILINGKTLLASAGSVTGEIDEINQVFEWVWYNIKSFIGKFFTF
jgi:anti-sigma factor RsiW